MPKIPAKKLKKLGLVAVFLALVGGLGFLFKDKLSFGKCPRNYSSYQDQNYSFCYPEFLGEVTREHFPAESRQNFDQVITIPAHDRLTFSNYPVAYEDSYNQPMINIYEAEGIAAEELESLLEEKNTRELKGLREIPGILPTYGAAQVIRTRQEFLEGSDFDGITYITGYAQNSGIPENTLTYAGKAGNKFIAGAFLLDVSFREEYHQKCWEEVDDPDTYRQVVQEYEEKVVERQNTDDVTPHPKLLDKIFETFTITQSPSSGEDDLTYTNQEYDFQLTMTPSWEGYTTRTEPVSDGHQLAWVDFYIPTSEDEYSDLPGYVDLMKVHIYPPEKWEEWYADCMAGKHMCVDQEIGRNDDYVFSWSHFNGFPPSDIPMEAVRDMEIIMESFEAL